MSDIGSEKYREAKAKGFQQWDTEKMNHSQKVTENVTLGEQMPSIPEHSRYYLMAKAFQGAFNQFAYGKGKERHVEDDNEPLDEQVSMWIEKHVPSYQLGQAVKKIVESQRFDKDAAIQELFGAMNFIGMKVVILMMSERTGTGVK